MEENQYFTSRIYRPFELRRGIDQKPTVCDFESPGVPQRRDY